MNRNSWVFCSVLSILLGYFVLHTIYIRHTYSVFFPNIPCIEPDEDYQYRTCKRFTVVVLSTCEECNPIIIRIPKDFKTDLVTIPKFLWRLISPLEKNLIAPGLLHDYLYQCPNMMSRLDADSIFYNALRQEGVSTIKANIFYIVVRWFGYVHYQDGQYCSFI